MKLKHVMAERFSALVKDIFYFQMINKNTSALLGLPTIPQIFNGLYIIKIELNNKAIADRFFMQ